MTRVLALVSFASLIGAIALIDTDQEVLAIVLFCVWLATGLWLLARRLWHAARDAVSDMRTFASGDVQTARIVSVGDPKGWFNPTSEVVFELEAGDGVTKRQFDREIPIPFFVAWGYRLSKRFRVPFVSETTLAEVMRLEFRREGLDLSVSRSLT
jgi:hypothetical protein